MSRKSELPKKMMLAERRLIAARLHKLGWTQEEIAERCGVTQEQISRDLSIVRERWAQEAVADIAEHKRRALEKIDEVEAAAWANYENGKVERALDTLLKCIERRCAILGVDAPKKVSVGPSDIASEIERELEELASRRSATVPVGTAPTEPLNGYHANGSAS